MIESRPGARDVVKMSLGDAAGGDTPMRRAMLVHNTETFPLDVLTSGYTTEEVEFALHTALDRWRRFWGHPPGPGDDPALCGQP